jgi:predicted RNA-binding Zn-ribbon protein involved in translation (DUF1610 family)
MNIFKGQNILNFAEEFPDDDSCKAYLAALKWSDGFVCPKCEHPKGCKKAGHKYHCYSCGNIESATANTLFHKVKFGLRKAFFIVFEMTASTKGMSSIQIGSRYGISQTTAWFFMQKVRGAMKSSENHLLTGVVHVDEFVVGGKEDGKQGRSYDTKKKKAAIAVELTDDHKVKRVYIKSIKDYSAKSLTPLFERHICKGAKITTDGWRGYDPIGKEYAIEKVPSNKGKNFKELHTIIAQVKSWLRTIPSPISKNMFKLTLTSFAIG